MSETENEYSNNPTEATGMQDAAVESATDPGAGASGSIDIILASSSPRRKKLLEDAGVIFRVVTGDADEDLDDHLKADPEQAAQQLAERKAGVIVQQILADAGFQGTTVVIGADTMVVLDGAIFGKPHSVSEGTGMLRKLSGRTHQVITGVSVWMVSASQPGKVSLGHKTFAETSKVTFKPLTDDQIAEYLRCGESFDKAGGYAIQGEGARLVQGCEGDFDNVIGLPVGRLLREFPDLKSSSSV